MSTFETKVDGIVCPNCTYDIARILKRLDGVNSVRASYVKSEVAVEFDPERVSEEEIEAALAKHGFPIGRGRKNLLWNLFDIACIAALYLALTALTQAVSMPEVGEGMSLGLVFLTGLLGDALTRKYNKYILKVSTVLIITMGLMLAVKGIKML